MTVTFLVAFSAVLYVDTGEDHDVPFGHPFAGYYLPYPDAEHSGLVSTICDEPPIMNWIYVDHETYEVKFGVRTNAQPNLTGPFDCTRQDRRLIFGGWEGFCVVQEGHFWALYFDVDRDRLKAKLGAEKVVLEVELRRVEMRVKPAPKDDQGPGGAEEAGKGAEEEKGENGGDDLVSPDVD
ncbi:hypothetical protein F5X68DRAFT_189601 [Plectosphaerella plurivora]|uniref:Uncharacterized protein n=1 Tax=Plectosphaerella plurivora TaxID=936078 RepID=A0A9P9ACV2_9PEZI|nr:hypothetical protein F5X68DRAFT_189601 [Plectosphaerella plurivora]